MGSLALLIAPTVVFLVFVVPYMSQNISPVFWVVRYDGSVVAGAFATRGTVASGGHVSWQAACTPAGQAG